VTGEQRPTFLVRLRPEPQVTDAVRAFRALLKLALRRFGLRCIDVHEEAGP
jgi:hypothetical protein